MNSTTYRRCVGVLLLITGAFLVKIPYTLLIINFDYHGILGQPPGRIRAQFHAGGPGLILTWLAFAWAGLRPSMCPLIFDFCLPRMLQSRKNQSIGNPDG